MLLKQIPFCHIHYHFTWVEEHLYAGCGSGHAGTIQRRPHQWQLQVNMSSIWQQQLQTLSVIWWQEQNGIKICVTITCDADLFAKTYHSLQPREGAMPLGVWRWWRYCAARWAWHKQHSHFCKSWRAVWHHGLILRPPSEETFIRNLRSGHLKNKQAFKWTLDIDLTFAPLSSRNLAHA